MVMLTYAGCETTVSGREVHVGGESSGETRGWRRASGVEDLLPAARPAVMGILNVTPDSFFDGGRYFAREAAVRRGIELAREGADLIDVGGESTRPGASPVCAEEEIERVVGVIERLVRVVDVPISIDTTKAKVAAAALDAGATMVNDVSAGTWDEQMLALAAERKCPIILMHMQGKPPTMQESPVYADVVGEVRAFLAWRRDRALALGVAKERIVLDPGIGFGKRLEHNLALLRDLPKLAELGCPVLVGVSRKSFIGEILDLPVGERLEGTAAAVAMAVARGARIVRVHDVLAISRVVKVAHAISEGRWAGS